MPNRSQSIPIDLTLPTEAIRRQLYDAVVAIHFTPAPGEILAAKRAGEWYQKHTADECGLQVVYLFGRWFVVWRQWEEIEDDTPESQEWEVLTVNARPSARFGIEFQEV
jgi:hypothetical protein